MLTVVLGLVFAGVVPWLQRDVRVHPVPAVGLGAAPLLGVLFGLGWTPCIGPTLGAVLSLVGHYGAQPDAGRVPGLRLLPGAGHPVRRRRGGVPQDDGAVGWCGATSLGDAVRRRRCSCVVGLLLVTGAWDAMIVHDEELGRWTIETVV